MDTVSNFINKLKIAYRAGKESFVFPASKFIFAIAGTLAKNGYIASVAKKGKKGRLLEVTLLYNGNAPKVTEVQRVSYLSKRVYRAARELRPVRSGYGIAVLSTPKGILSNKEARAANVGGEVLFEIW